MWQIHSEKTQLQGYKVLQLGAVSMVCAEGLAGTWCSHVHPVPTAVSLCLIVRVMNLTLSSAYGPSGT